MGSEQAHEAPKLLSGWRWPKKRAREVTGWWWCGCCCCRKSECCCMRDCSCAGLRSCCCSNCCIWCRPEAGDNMSDCCPTEETVLTGWVCDWELGCVQFCCVGELCCAGWACWAAEVAEVACCEVVDCPAIFCTPGLPLFPFPADEGTVFAPEPESLSRSRSRCCCCFRALAREEACTARGDF